MKDSQAKRLTKDHGLLRLWQLFKIVDRRVLREVQDKPRPLDDIQGVEAYIKQLDSMDAGSYAFRYALTRTGEASIDSIDRINLTQFSTYMDRLCEYLDGFDFHYGYILDMQEEMYANCDPGDMYLRE